MKLLVKCRTSEIVEIYVCLFYLTTIWIKHLQCVKTGKQTNIYTVYIMYIQPREH